MAPGQRRSLSHALSGVEQPDERKSISSLEEATGGRNESLSSHSLPLATEDTADETKLMQAMGLPTQFGRVSPRNREGRRETGKKNRGNNCVQNGLVTARGIGGRSAHFGNGCSPPGPRQDGLPGFASATTEGTSFTGSVTEVTVTGTTKLDGCGGLFEGKRRRGDGECECGEMADILLQDPSAEMEEEAPKTETEHTNFVKGQRKAPPVSYDHVGNSMTSSYYRLRYELFRNYDDGVLFDENAWYETTLECIASYLASELRRVAGRSKRSPYENHDDVSSRTFSVQSHLPPACNVFSGGAKRETQQSRFQQNSDSHRELPTDCDAEPESLHVVVGVQRATKEIERRAAVSSVSETNQHATEPREDLAQLRSQSSHSKYSSQQGDSSPTKQAGYSSSSERETLEQGHCPSVPDVERCFFPTAARGHLNKPLYAMDGCCGAGGNLIQFARYFDACIGVDCDLVKVAICKHNASVCGVADRVYVHHNTLAGWLFERQKARQKAIQSAPETFSTRPFPSRLPPFISPGAPSQTSFSGEPPTGSQLCWCAPEFSHLKCRFCRTLPPEGEPTFCWPPDSARTPLSTPSGGQDKSVDSVILPGGYLRFPSPSMFSLPSACRLPSAIPVSSPKVANPLSSSSKSTESLTADISWCFMSPPWSGPTYSGRRSFHSQLYSIAGGQNGGGGVGSAHIPSLVKAAAR